LKRREKIGKIYRKKEEKEKKKVSCTPTNSMNRINVTKKKGCKTKQQTGRSDGPTQN
jgi:hypothetical protein